MTSTFDYPDHRTSKLKSLDARWKVAGFLIAMLCMAFLKTPMIGVAGVIASLLLLMGTWPDSGWWLPRIFWIVAGILVFILPTPFLTPGETFFEYGILKASKEGLDTSVLIFSRGLAISILALALIGSSTIQDLVRGANGFGLPSKICSIFWLGFRHLDLLSHEFKRMRVALRARGYKINTGFSSYKTIAWLSANMLVRALDRSEHVGLAIKARGFHGVFTSLETPKTTWREVGFFFAMILIPFSLLVLDFWLGN
ncbi:MAG: energy-coupling factor transporter transmembrane protein EcfT [Planctomycetes bacterium]|nr:energy-coupling factor transporter transmembrane protein EcfT [Planctomycetota bacterium]